MGHILPCVPALFLLNTLLHYGHAEDAVLTLEPNWSIFFEGESVTFVCDINEGEDSDWLYKIHYDGREFIYYNTHKRYTLHLATGNSAEYQCFGQHKRSYNIKKSNVVSLTVLRDIPKARLTPGTTTIPAGGSVTLTCSVEGSDGWKYTWYTRTLGSSEAQTLRNSDPNKVINISQGGVYLCTGCRGNPAFCAYGDEVTIRITFSNVATVTLQPNWPQIFRRETITVRCDIQRGEGTEWQYEWRTPSSTTEPAQSNPWRISESHSGAYMCKGRSRKDPYSSTEWSEAVTVTVSEPMPVLTVSPSWLSPGASVTLSCEVKHPSPGWRFYWYKAVPALSKPDGRYSYELLPGNSSGTEQNSFVIHEQTHTAGYVCKAVRGDPAYETDYSQSKFVWSGDFHPAASLRVSPDQVQHFIYDSLSLSCEGNSTEWRVRRFIKRGNVSCCSSWGRMTGSTCNVHNLRSIDAVFWCESGSGEFSNAVNITVKNYGIMLVSPAHPVAEGASVTLLCKLRTENVPSNVFFYKNNKLIQNDTRRELTIPEVSTSHEGFYKCEGNDSVQPWRSWKSPKSWMSVKLSGPESSLFPVPLVAGLVCGTVLITLLLLLLFCYRKSKGSRSVRSQNTNQISATDHVINQDETPLHGQPCLYESIKGTEDTVTSQDVTYASIELKNIASKRRSTPSAAYETVYSEVKPGTAHDE
ncbi:uncharacterized protein LOC121177472 [Toxotes jaculatrix]|uniref:uncharacterized protein LOC121177472 n=1 Tax=Toxotes jaculatrix TaxID=941984 RepID=UPI001B3A8433|nr:uncharacterized protein LOC121177472 [Toxotes jaculatrix]